MGHLLLCTRLSCRLLRNDQTYEMDLTSSRKGSNPDIFLLSNQKWSFLKSYFRRNQLDDKDQMCPSVPGRALGFRKPGRRYLFPYSRATKEHLRPTESISISLCLWFNGCQRTIWSFHAQKVTSSLLPFVRQLRAGHLQMKRKNHQPKA